MTIERLREAIYDIQSQQGWTDSTVLELILQENHKRLQSILTQLRQVANVENDQSEEG